MSEGSVIVLVCSTIPHLVDAVRARLTDSAVLVQSISPSLNSEGLLKICNNARKACLLADPAHSAPLLDMLATMDNCPISWVQSTWAGVESIIGKPVFKDSKITLTRIAGVFGQLMAEYVLGHIIAVERGFVALHEAQNSRVWAPRKVYRRLDNLKLGVLGIGDIGQGIAAAARTGFHMHVIGFCSNKLTYAHQDMFEKVYDYSDNGLRSLLAEVDYIVSVLPHTEKTSGLLNGDMLESCKIKRPILINVGRGSLISEDALLNALGKDWISGAILDVFVDEPLSADSPLWQHPKITITPHVSAVSLPSDVVQVFTDNFKLFQNGDSLRHVVEPDRGY